ncbi:MAG: prepilin peptidase [Microbacteriaceae bacterium]|nr:prepilin peptidase [Microbacteriaceae bacterium]
MPSLSELIALIPALYLLVVAWPLTVIDLREHRLPNRLVLPAFPVAFLAQLIATIISADWARQLSAVLIAMAVGVIGLGANYIDTLGMGDVKLATVIALTLGYFNPWLPVIAIGIAFVLAFAVVIVLITLGKVKIGSSIPLGPYLLVSFIGANLSWLITN